MKLAEVRFGIKNPKTNKSEIYTGHSDCVCGRYHEPILFGSFIVDHSISTTIVHAINKGSERYCINIEASDPLGNNVLYGHIDKNYSEVFVTRGRDNYDHVIVRASIKPQTIAENDGMIRVPVFLNGEDDDIEEMLRSTSTTPFPDEYLEPVYEAIHYNSKNPFVKDWTAYVAEDARSHYNWYNIGIITAIDDARNKLYRYGFNHVAYLLLSDSNIDAAVRRGLREGNIKLGAGVSEKASNVTGMDSYLEAFGQILADKTTKQFAPVYDPTKEKISDKVNGFFNVCRYYMPSIEAYDVQKNVIQASVKNLDSHSGTLISGETGAGKTLMAIGSVVCHARKNNYATIVMVPSNLTTRWKDAIKSVVPTATVMEITNLHSLLRAVQIAKNKARVNSFWAIISDSTAKAEADRHPAVIYSKSKGGFICPHCGRRISIHTNTREYSGDMAFLTENDMNKYCDSVIDKDGKFIDGCKQPLWEDATKNNSKNWVKITDCGWVYRPRIKELKSHFETLINSDSVMGFNGRYVNITSSAKRTYTKKLKAIAAYESSGSVDRFPQRYNIGHYLKKHCKNVFDYGVFDEVHTFAGNSKQGEAFGNITNSVWKSIFLTGTLSNGYASGLFYLLFRTQTKRMLEFGYDHSSLSKFVNTYGVKEITVIESGSRTSSGGFARDARRAQKKKRELPGISPTLFTDFLLSNTVFVSKRDIKENLCKYTETPMAVKMDDELNTAYTTIVTGLSTYVGAQSRAEARNSILTASMFLDQPYGIDTRHRDDDEIIELDHEKIRPKEQKLIDLAKEKKAAGEKMLIYCEYTRKLDILNRLQKLLTDNGINAIQMNDKIKRSERQSWLEEQAQENDIDAIILNPSLVEVGLNLLSYTTIIFYEVGTKLTTIRQASQRSNRINQTHPVSVYFFYYENTIQEDMLGLISQKLKASKALEGDFSESALQSMTEDTDILTHLVNSIVKNDHIKVNTDNFDIDGDDEDEEDNHIDKVEDIDEFYKDRHLFFFKPIKNICNFCA